MPTRMTCALYRRTIRRALFGLAAVVVMAALSACGTAGKASPEKTAALTADDRAHYRELYTAGLLAREEGDDLSALYFFRRAQRIAPDEAANVFQLGLLRQELSGDSLSLEADSLLRRAVALAPQNVDYKEALAQHLLMQQDSALLGEAAGLYEDISVRKKDPEESLQILLRIYLTMRDLPKMLATLDRLAVYMDDPSEVAGGRVMIYRAMEDTAGIVSTLEDYVTAADGSAEGLVWAAAQYLSLDMEDRALPLMQRAQEMDADSPDLQQLLITYHNTNNHTRELRDVIHRSLLNPRTEEEQREKLLNICALYAMFNTGGEASDTLLSDREWAQQLLRELFDVSPTDDKVALTYAKVLDEVEAPQEEKMRVWRRLIDLNTMAKPSYLRIAMAYSAAEDWAAYEAILQESTERQPHELIFFYLKALRDYQQNRTTEAIATLQTGIEQRDSEDDDLDFLADCYTLLADMLHSVGRLEDCFKAYDKALEAKADNLLTLNNYAYFLSLEGRDLERAQEMSRKTVEAEPQNATYLDTYAWVLFTSGQLQQARIYEEQALSHIDDEENHAVYYDHYGDILRALGENEAAHEAWLKAQEMAEQADLVYKLLDKLKLK